jgi:hypothetical protein
MATAAINRFNAEVLIPELRAAKKNVTVKTYGGQFHCFCFRGYRMTAPASGVRLAPAS